MTPLPWSLRIYIAGMVILVTCSAILAILCADPPAPSDLILAVVLGGLMMIAWLEPFPLSFKRKLYLDTTVVVAAILVLQPGVAMIAVMDPPHRCVELGRPSPISECRHAMCVRPRRIRLNRSR